MHNGALCLLWSFSDTVFVFSVWNLMDLLILHLLIIIVKRRVILRDAPGLTEVNLRFVYLSLYLYFGILHVWIFIF